MTYALRVWDGATGLPDAQRREWVKNALIGQGMSPEGVLIEGRAL